VLEIENRVLICAPRGRDAALIAATLAKENLRATTVGVESLCREIAQGAGAGIIAEEALDHSGLFDLALTLRDQDPWSDLPIIILTSGGETSAERTWNAVRALDDVANVTLLERPLRPITLLSAVQVSLRSRRRQYQMRSMNEELERRVLARTTELQRLITEAEGFSYTISHDLRSPLRAIVSSSQILIEDYGELLPPEGKEELRIQADAANNLAKLIDDLLHLSRLSREEIRPADLDLSDIAEGVAHQLSLDSQATHCVFDIQPGVTARGDATLLRIAILNLLQNACKFSSGKGCIEFGQAPDGAYFVRDHGIGFEQRYAEKMFLPFERLVNAKEYPGTGIGLANVRRIIERHGGKIWAESGGLHHGATFYFSLPS
jgi:signal transduction histidine kinase